MWRIYLDNLEDTVALMTNGVHLRNKSIPVLLTNPNRPDNENSVKIRVKSIPLSVSDDIILRSLVLKDLEIISNFQEKLRINNKLTNCETGDRIYYVKPASLKSPLSSFMYFGKFKGRVLHFGQKQTTGTREPKCGKCLENGHRTYQCENDWKCRLCNQLGHKQADCTDLFEEDTPLETPQTQSHSDTDSDHDSDYDQQQTIGTASKADHARSPSKTRARADQRPQRKQSETPRRPKASDKTQGQRKMTQCVNSGSSHTVTPAKRDM